MITQPNRCDGLADLHVSRIGPDIRAIGCYQAGGVAARFRHEPRSTTCGVVDPTEFAGEGSAAAERTAPTPRTIANIVTSGVAAMSTDSPLTIISTGTIESGNGVAVTGSGRNACGVTHSG